MIVFLIIALLILLVACLCAMMHVRSLREQVRDLQKSDSMKTTFIKALGREIRTPLHSVSGMAEVISREDLYLSKSEKKNITDQIKYNTSLISTLLDEVAIYTEGSEGHCLQDERFSPNSLINRCLEGNRTFLHKGVKLLFRRDLGDDQFVSADRHIVEVVLNKLVFSACKFTMEGEVVVNVEDTGAGIPEDRKNKMFTWFDDPNDMRDETEFDLAVAQRLASKIGGYLHYDERYTRGTRMEFTLPVR